MIDKRKYTINFTTKMGMAAIPSKSIKTDAFAEAKLLALDTVRDSHADIYTFSICEGKRVFHFSAAGRAI
jgi:hypothetical protein